MAENQEILRSYRESMFNALGEEPYERVLERVQKHVSSSLIQDVANVTESDLKDAIMRYITDFGIKCDLTESVGALTDAIYHDMAGYSFITREQLFEKKGFEEININAWNDVEVVQSGVRKKTPYSFLSPSHAQDILLRMFRKTHTLFDDANPRATADIGGGIRITALKCPLVDPDIAVAASIRKVNMQVITPNMLLQTQTLTPKMLDFLMLCLNHGASMCISGETGAGKTTLAGALLSRATQKLRTYTIEEGSREWNMVDRDETGRIMNSVIHTRTRLNEANEQLNIDQELLVKDSLRFDPDIIAPGEVRSREAFEVMGVSNTGHTVVTTTHSNGTLDTPERIVTLAKKAYDMSDATLMSMAARAFPILVHCEKHQDRRRRVTEIREVTGYEQGAIQSQLLFEYVIDDNIFVGDECVEVKGEFLQRAGLSAGLQQRLLKKGARKSEIEPYLQAGRA